MNSGGNGVKNLQCDLTGRNGKGPPKRKKRRGRKRSAKEEILGMGKAENG